jgi:endonuclease YncB( thermonuclease family)
MSQQQSLIALISRLYRQKYPIPIIIIAVILSLVTSQWHSLPSFQKTDECEILSIYDGDTMTLQCPNKTEKTRVRLYCIDTPEKKQTPWGDKARDHLRAITSKHVRLVEIDKDRYGRTVGEVYAGDVNLNLAQVEAGQAAVYDAYCKDPKYKVAENHAKSTKKGIWAMNGLHQTPWKWRKKH